MIVFFLYSVVCMLDGYLFSVFFVLYMFFSLVDVSWAGYFFFFDSYMYVVLMLMVVFIIGLIVMVEAVSVLVFFSVVLVVISFMFFFCMSVMMMYIFFELSVFPILVMVLGYGSQVEKISASYYLIFYALFCSTPFLYVYFVSDFFLFFAYYDVVLSWEMLFCVTLCFLVKFPVYFLHLWLPKVHVEAPTVASMMLAGLLLKLGTVGFMRLMELYEGVQLFFWLVVGVLGMVVGSFLCVFQSDVKSLVAYSSVVHMNFVFFVFVLGGVVCKVSGVLMMFVHGYVSVMMFFLVGEFFHSCGTRAISYAGGFLVSGLFVVFLVIMVFLCNAGLPPSLSFFSEIVGVVGMMVSWVGLFVFLFFYFFVAFYFSLYLMTIFLMGGDYVNFDFFVLSCVVPGIILVFDFFWLVMIF